MDAVIRPPPRLRRVGYGRPTSDNPPSLELTRVLLQLTNKRGCRKLPSKLGQAQGKLSPKGRTEESPEQAMSEEPKAPGAMM